MVGYPYCREQKSSAAIPGDGMACLLPSTRASSMFAGPVIMAVCVTEKDSKVCQDSSANLDSEAILAVEIPDQAPWVPPPPLPPKVRVAGRIRQRRGRWACPGPADSWEC